MTKSWPSSAGCPAEVDEVLPVAVRRMRQAAWCWSPSCNARVRVLLRNWHGYATVPSRSLYPHQWSWDSAFIALGLQHISPRRAATELLSLFGAQWADGRIPQIAFNPAVPDDAYFPGPSVWRSSAIDGHPPIDYLGNHPAAATRSGCCVDRVAAR